MTTYSQRGALLECDGSSPIGQRGVQCQVVAITDHFRDELRDSLKHCANPVERGSALREVIQIPSWLVQTCPTWDANLINVLHGNPIGVAIHRKYTLFRSDHPCNFALGGPLVGPESLGVGVQPHP